MESLLTVVITALTSYLTFIRCANDISFRIVGGNEALKGQFPWQVGIKITISDGTSKFCGGALISRIWVLTAAHCMQNVREAIVIVDTIKIYPLLEILHATFLQSGKRYRMVDFFTHEEYQRESLVYDAALLKLDQSVEFNVHVHEIALDGQDFVQPNNYITISGWGRTGNAEAQSSNLKCIDMLIISFKECQTFYKSKIDSNTTFCAIGEGADNICVGDSGGAAIYYKDGTPIHVGILSFLHSSGCEKMIPVGFTKTYFFREWIRDISGV